jgi:nuclear pore complex protein Nup160
MTGTDHGLSFEDQDALASVLPGAELFDSSFSFYLHVSNIFKMSSLVYHEVEFAQLAVAVAPPEDTSALWVTIVKGYTDLGMYEDAYAFLMAYPYEKLCASLLVASMSNLTFLRKRDCVGHLTYRMCEDNALETLMSFNFAGIADEVEAALSFKARNVDPRVRPCYSKILYLWYIRRGDYRNGMASAWSTVAVLLKFL